MKNIFSFLEVPTVNCEMAERLERPITNMELLNSVKSLQSGKAPGPDGFPANFDKIYEMSPNFNEEVQGSICRGHSFSTDHLFNPYY